MDFAVCPSCNQSVLDDDAVDCPFCGSPMKGKPGAKPTTPKPGGAPTGKPAAPVGKAAAPAGAAAKPTAPKPGGPAKPGSKAGVTAASDDFPFDAADPSVKSALQAMPTATKQRTLEVVCPMCDTHGFVVPTAAGQEVKCANPKCPMPIFKAPKAVVEAPPPPPPPKSNMLPIMGGAVALLALLGGGWYFMSQPSNSGPKPGGGLSAEALAELEAMNKSKKNIKPSIDTPEASVDPSLTPKKSQPGDQSAAPTTSDELVAASIKVMRDACLIGESRSQRSKPFCRQLAAEANAIIGDDAAMIEHLTQLTKVGPELPYYRISSKLEVYWRETAAGNTHAAVKALNEAMADAAKLPKVGRARLETAGRLAAALATAGRISDGMTLLTTHNSEKGDGQLAALVQLAGDGRVTRLANVYSLLPWTAPQAVAATGTLIARNQMAVARNWSLAQPTDEAKSECLAMWAEAVSKQQSAAGPASSSEGLAAAVDTLPPQLAARVWARAALGRLRAKDNDGAAATLKLASETLAKFAVPPEPTILETKPMMKYERPAFESLVQAATTAGEIAAAYSSLPMNLKEGTAALDLALSYARGIGPGWDAAAKKVEEAEQRGSGGLREWIRKELGLKSEDEARQASSKYRRAIDEQSAAAQLRLDLQTRILTKVADSPLKNHVWLLASSRSSESDPVKRDNLLGTSLTADLLEAFRGSETEKDILGAIDGSNPPARPELVLLREQLEKGDIPGVATALQAIDNKSSRREELTLMFVTQLADKSQVDKALQLAGNLDDAALREESYRLIAALAAQRGQEQAIWKQINQTSQATEKVALCRGLIGGFKTPKG